MEKQEKKIKKSVEGRKGGLVRKNMEKGRNIENDASCRRRNMKKRKWKHYEI